MSEEAEHLEKLKKVAEDLTKKYSSEIKAAQRRHNRAQFTSRMEKGFDEHTQFRFAPDQPLSKEAAIALEHRLYKRERRPPKEEAYPWTTDSSTKKMSAASQRGFVDRMDHSTKLRKDAIVRLEKKVYPVQAKPDTISAAALESAVARLHHDSIVQRQRRLDTVAKKTWPTKQDEKIDSATLTEAVTRLHDRSITRREDSLKALDKKYATSPQPSPQVDPNKLKETVSRLAKPYPHSPVMEKARLQREYEAYKQQRSAAAAQRSMALTMGFNDSEHPSEVI